MQTQRTHLWSQPGKERVGHAGTVALTHTGTICDADRDTHTPPCVMQTGTHAHTLCVTHTSTMCDADTGTQTPVCVHIHIHTQRVGSRRTARGAQRRAGMTQRGGVGVVGAAQGEEMHIRRSVHAEGQPEPTQQCTATTLQ